MEDDVPKFTTISPTHVPGKKPEAWARLEKGRYVAIGWLEDTDLTGKTAEEVSSLIRKKHYENETEALDCLRKFIFGIAVGDYIGVNNVRFGLFGIGKIESGYQFQQGKHDSGGEDEYYSHYRTVEWLVTGYLPSSSLVGQGEVAWEPYGTMGKVHDHLPPYVERVLGLSDKSIKEPLRHVRPDFLSGLIGEVNELRADDRHQERAHESLVEQFFASLGFKKHRDIKFRQGSLDLCIEHEGQPLVIVEVKRDWNLSIHSADAVKQGYWYAHDRGVRYVILTNGDTYIVFDRMKGLSWKANLVAEFRLSTLTEDDLRSIEALRPQRMTKPDLNEIFRRIAECFPVEGPSSE